MASDHSTPLLYLVNSHHRRTSQELGAANPLFFGQKPAAKNERKKVFFLCLLNEKTEFILSSEIKRMPEIRDFY